jgi:hypothetical protein
MERRGHMENHATGLTMKLSSCFVSFFYVRTSRFDKHMNKCKLIANILAISLSVSVVAGISSVFIGFYTSKLNIFAQNSKSIASQIDDQQLTDQLATRIQNKTGGENVLMKPIIEQIANQILNKHGYITLHNSVVNLTLVVKHSGRDIVSQSIYTLASNEVAGNVTSVNQAISQISQEIGSGVDPKQVVMAATSKLKG